MTAPTLIPCAGFAPTVLLVEPDKDCRQLIALTLRTTGVRVICTRDAEEALLILRDIHPPLVILELNLPPPVGLALIRTMTGGGLRGTAIIVLTTISGRGWVEQAMAVGCTLYLCKPFSLQTLRLAVTRLLAELQSLLYKPEHCSTDHSPLSSPTGPPHDSPNCLCSGQEDTVFLPRRWRESS